MTEQQLLNEFGAAALAGNAAVFVGSGLSKAASRRFPDWSELVEPMRREAQIPSSISDLPLVAEYYEQDCGRERLDSRVASAVGRVRAPASLGHQLLAQLPVSEFWTTNYDRLLETAVTDATVIFNENSLANRLRSGHKRVIKMHGSLSPAGSWEAAPVITRGDYERYEQTHPRMWAALTATFLTRSFLFIGFGFADPNIEVFMRLARQLHWGVAEHYAVLRRPTERADALLHRHQVRDLERSGVGVVEIDDFNELVPLLQSLVRRCRPPQLFVSGSGNGLQTACRRFGQRLAALHHVTVVSLAGDAGRSVSYGFADELRRLGRYDADRIRFLFRAKSDPIGIAPPAPDQRTGVSVYTGLSVEILRRDAIDSARALLVAGGGKRTWAEARIAKKLGVPVIPLAATGNVARKLWSMTRPRVDKLTVGGAPVDRARYLALSDRDGRRHIAAALHLVRQAMYL